MWSYVALYVVLWYYIVLSHVMVCYIVFKLCYVLLCYMVSVCLNIGHTESSIRKWCQSPELQWWLTVELVAPCLRPNLYSRFGKCDGNAIWYADSLSWGYFGTDMGRVNKKVYKVATWVSMGWYMSPFGDFEHHLPLFLGDYIPIVGWCSIWTFTKPCYEPTHTSCGMHI